MNLWFCTYLTNIKIIWLHGFGQIYCLFKWLQTQFVSIPTTRVLWYYMALMSTITLADHNLWVTLMIWYLYSVKSWNCYLSWLHNGNDVILLGFRYFNACLYSLHVVRISTNHCSAQIRIHTHTYVVASFQVCVESGYLLPAVSTFICVHDVFHMEEWFHMKETSL